VLITDHSSIGFEYLLLDRPLVRIAMPHLITGADISTEYVDLMAAASTTVEDAAEVLAAVARAVSHPGQGSDQRRALAAELFHAPGKATARAIDELYALLELDVPCAIAAGFATRVPRAGEPVGSVRLQPDRGGVETMPRDS
jgi:hypothetical protein